MTSREIITIQTGGFGNSLGSELFKKLAYEHSIDSQGFRRTYKNQADIDNVSVFFKESRDGTFSPRAILSDLSPIGSPGRSVREGGLALRPSSNIVCLNSGSGNCYANAFHTSGPPVAQ